MNPTATSTAASAASGSQRPRRAGERTLPAGSGRSPGGGVGGGGGLGGLVVAIATASRSCRGRGLRRPTRDGRIGYFTESRDEPDPLVGAQRGAERAGAVRGARRRERNVDRAAGARARECTG